MKKKIIIACIVILLLVLFVPIPTGVMKDGGTRVYSALTYKIVDWNRLYDCGQTYSKTKIYPFPLNFLSIDSLFEREEKNLEYIDCDYDDTEQPTTVNHSFDCRYIRTNGSPDNIEYPIVKIMRSQADLQDYYENNKDVYYLESRESVSSDSTIGFIDACKVYDDEFFSNNVLLVIVLEEGSGSIRHLVDKVTTTERDGNLQADVEISRKVPGACTDDMAVWHVLIDVSSEFGNVDENSVRVFVDGALKNRNTTTVKHSKYYANISFELIDGWEYDVLEVADDSSVLTNPAFEIVVFPKGDKNNHICFEYGPNGYCGTGLTLKDTSVGRYSAREGTYSSNKYWNFLELKNTAGQYMIFNNCSNEVYSKYKHEIESMLQTLVVGEGCVSEFLAVETAKKFATIEYDTIRAEFGSHNGVWQISFINGKTDDIEIVNISYDGELDDRVFNE